MTIGVGIVGVGIMGAEHARLLGATIAGSAVTSVFDIDEPRARAVAAACGADVAGDPLVLIKDDAVDAVVIASSDATHEELVLACLAAGKPVLCEKPLAPTPDGCRRIVDAEGELGQRLVSVGFMRRFDPGYAAIRSQLHDGAIGRALVLHCVHRNAHAAGVTSPFVISGSAVHEFDVARWLLDDEPVAVTVHRPRPSAAAGGAQDPVVLIVEMAGGVLVDIEVFVNAGYGYDVRTELVGEAGVLTADAGAPVTRRANGVVSASVHSDWRDRFAAAYRLELQDWVDAVTAGTTPTAASAWDGYAATATATAAIDALQTGERTPVRLGERPERYR